VDAQKRLRLLGVWEDTGKIENEVSHKLPQHLTARLVSESMTYKTWEYVGDLLHTGSGSRGILLGLDATRYDPIEQAPAD